jgi:hypothetical protein
MGATERQRAAWARQCTALALLGGLWLGADASAAASEPAWSVEAAGLLAVPIAPTAFRSNWIASWGIAGGVCRSLGTRTSVGLEGLYAQYGLGDVAGDGVGGGTRHWGSVRIPCAVLLWEGRRWGDVGLTASAGYTHQSIEPITNAAEPLRSGNADGVAGSIGLRYSRPLREESRWSIGCEYTTTVLAHETPGALFVRFGIASPLRGSPATP